jgi:biopolymer transport protein TolR
MARLKRRSHLTTIREINMTPLIDLTFLLLIVFMITVPLMEYGVNVSPPELNAVPLPENDSIYVNLNKSGQVVLSKQTLQSDELTLKLKALLKNRGKINVLLRADGSRPYSEVMNTIKAIKAAGVKDISLVTQSESSE